jgi:hypothetical protein
MPTLYEMPVLDTPDQTFTCSMNGKRCQIRIVYNVMSQRWSFDLWVNDALVLTGRRIVTGCDLVEAFAFGIGRIVAAAWEGEGLAPDRQNLPAGRVRLFHIAD